MDLYTIFLEFRGGTYIKQVRAKDLNEALDVWAKTIDVSEIAYFGKASQKQLINQMPSCSDKEPTLINQCKNVWFTTASLTTGFGLINIVKTSEE